VPENGPYMQFNRSEQREAQIEGSLKELETSKRKRKKKRYFEKGVKEVTPPVWKGGIIEGLIFPTLSETAVKVKKGGSEGGNVLQPE